MAVLATLYIVSTDLCSMYGAVGQPNYDVDMDEICRYCMLEETSLE